MASRLEPGVHGLLLTEPQKPECAECGKVANLCCSGCKAVSYCSVSCQSAQWKSLHRQWCADTELYNWNPYHWINFRANMGPTIPGAEEELVASMIRAIKWELSLWILGNQRDIATNAIQGLLLDDQLVGLPRARSESEWVLSLHLVAMMRPPLADISPFDLTACDIEPRGAVAQRLRVTGLYILPDPRPGAAAAVQSAISSGRRIVLVYCFCEPVAFELYIIVPDPLPAYRPESDWQTNLQRTVNPRPAVSTEKCFCLLDDSCPDELGDLSESADVMDLMRRWADFYDGPMMAAAYKALDIFKRPHACDEFVYAIHIHRHENQLSRKAVAFSFQVVVAEKVRNTELAQWIRRQRFAISRNDLDDRRLHDMVANEKGYKRDPSHISVQTFVYATSYGKSENLNDWQCCPLPFHVWIRRSTRPAYPDIGASPLAYLQDMVKRGVFCPCQQYTRNGIQCAGVSSSPECTGRARHLIHSTATFIELESFQSLAFLRSLNS